MAQLLDEQKPSSYTGVYQIFRQVVENELEGTWAIVCHITHPQYKTMDSLLLSRYGSPLLLGYGHDPKKQDIFIASEQEAFTRYTTHWMNLPEKCAIQVFRNQKIRVHDDTLQWLHEYVPHQPIFRVEKDNSLRQQQQQQQPYKTAKNGYQYWTEKEICEQSKTLWEVLNRGGRVYQNQIKLGGLEQHKNELMELNHLFLIGCGTSYYAGLWGSRMLKQWALMDTVQVMDASEMESIDLPQQGKTGLIVISQSGETRDCIRVVQEMKDKVHITMGIINVVGSQLTTLTDCGIYLNAGREWGVASTKSFTAQTVALTLMALWFYQQKHGVSASAITRTQSWVQQLVLLSNQFKHHTLRIRQQIQQQIIPLVEHSSSIFILGRSWSYPLAMEGALKLKELTYVHTEGFPGGGLKHGPFALIDQGTPIFVLMFHGPYYSRMVSACQEMALRGATIVAITNDPSSVQKLHDKNIVQCIIVLEEEEEWVASLLSVLVFQWLAVDLAIHKSYNPDYPRHLAKVVTVDG